MKYDKPLYILLLVGLCLAPWLGAYPVFVLKLLCFGLFACAFNLLTGFTGLLSFGHAAFFGGAGYIFALCVKSWGLTPELALVAGTVTAALLGWVMGVLAIRREGIYFAMITLALAQMLFFFCLQSPLTGGEDGIQGVPRGKLFGLVDLANDRVLYYIVLAVVALAFAFIMRVVRSPFGQILRAIRENEPRATSLGYDTHRFKLIAFVLSAALSGLAGSLKVLVMGFETLTDVHWSMSGLVILMTLAGGLGTLIGPLVGAVLIVTLENKLGEMGTALAHWTGIGAFNVLGQSVTTVTGAIFVICVLAFRRGIMGELIHRLPRKPD
jgi:branched-chain amino acid transport system permease protein